MKETISQITTTTIHVYKLFQLEDISGSMFSTYDTAAYIT